MKTYYTKPEIIEKVINRLKSFGPLTEREHEIIGEVDLALPESRPEPRQFAQLNANVKKTYQRA